MIETSDEYFLATHLYNIGYKSQYWTILIFMRADFYGGRESKVMPTILVNTNIYFHKKKTI